MGYQEILSEYRKAEKNIKLSGVLKKDICIPDEIVEFDKKLNRLVDKFDPITNPEMLIRGLLEAAKLHACLGIELNEKRPSQERTLEILIEWLTEDFSKMYSKMTEIIKEINE